MADPGLVAATLMGVETTLYAVAMAVYMVLFTRAQTTLVERLILVFAPPETKVRDLVERSFSHMFAMLFVAFISLAYFAALITGLVSMMTDSLTPAYLGGAFFAGAYLTFFWGVERELPKQVEAWAKVAVEFAEIVRNAHEGKP